MRTPWIRLLLVPVLLTLVSCATPQSDTDEDLETAEASDPADFNDEEVASDDSNQPESENTQAENQEPQPQEEPAQQEPEQQAANEVKQELEENPPQEPQQVVEATPQLAPEIAPPPPVVVEKPIVQAPPAAPVAPVPPKEKDDANELEKYLMGQTQFVGRKINIEAHNEDIRNLFRLIAEESGANIVLDDKVNGNMTVKLRQVPWDQAMTVIMKTKGLGYIREGNVLRVAPLDVLKQEFKTAREITDAREQNDPIRVKIIPVSYASVDDLVKQAQPFLSPQGKITSDPRTSSLILTDTSKVAERIVRMVRTLDVQPDQVLIEGKIVEAQDQFRREIGVRWETVGMATAVSRNRMGIPVNFTPSMRITPPPASTNGLNLDLRLGTLDILGDLTAALALAEADSLVKVVSSPRIVAVNKEKAEITQSVEVPVEMTTIAPGAPAQTAFSFVPAQLKLSVTPQVTADGRVVMEMMVKREFFGAREANGVRSRNSREAKTRVVVRSGQTAVIGGIYDNQETTSQGGIPWLRSLPILGWLFRQNAVYKEKNELMIFLTPRILSASDTAESNQ
jgi:type IV pilus assembly protein PilQ